MEPLRFPGSLDSLSLIREHVKSAAQSAGLDKKATYNLCLAVDEVATNIILHGYEEAGRSGPLDMLVELDGGELKVILEDDAAPFDPQRSRLPDGGDLSQPLEERPIGGLGLFLAFEGVDEFRYERAGGRNRNIFIVHARAGTQTNSIHG